ncbi:MAG: trimeric intracellular cation channel family protein [Phycisphaerales bacterium]|nr:MAG: trimeric intracellular cation channel family protein [Phycisphaerales bacterium]
MQTLLYVMDLFGVAVFAITGSLAAGRKHMDLFGVVVLATVTALGGGTLRDLILGARPVFWVSAPVYLLVAVATAIVTFFLVRFREPPRKLLSVADAFGLAVFTVLGTQKALDLGTSAGIAVVMGVMTGVFGGMIRDVLSGEIPLILRREIYATASLCGAITFWGISITLQSQSLAAVISVAVTLGLRLSAIKWKMSLPLFVSHDKDR